MADRFDLDPNMPTLREIARDSDGGRTLSREEWGELCDLFLPETLAAAGLRGPGAPPDTQPAPTSSTASVRGEPQDETYAPDEGLVQQVLANHPGLTREEALEMLEAFGA